ncbi:YhcN/YlaJ family sporulation lipoprotein [Lentibacillus sp.]|uniref:YhcN/YlaJ family sporulation lipoprotein n=1 Tax=Lentibacillus sp. TaxID=1925746 RepID=UPI002B4AB98B|nr:YhcN/YlaJ family sporulation lipoprotein [Lentibacillus sp.]HLS07565.1 YhcN/YlaJ family sporulation lipoprotein [Lentibacillus sp.]
MQRVKWMIIPLFTVVLFGCAQYESGEQDDSENMNSQPINYETEEEEKERLGAEDQGIDEQGGYLQSEQKELNDGDENAKSDAFTNEMSMSISKHLQKRKDVRQVQVAVTDERVVVGIMLSEHAPPDMRERVEQEVQEMVPTKEVYVYTDDIYWDRMRNKDKQLDQLNGDIREYLREFFNRDREHF